MSNSQKKTDVILIGAGVMSATLGSLLKLLAPEWNIKVFEKLECAGKESSNEWNNAGTGHSALCEMNYTDENEDGSIDVSKALEVNEQFQISMQFWSYLVNQKRIHHPKDFIMSLPHISMVEGVDNVRFLKKRFEALTKSSLFEGMEFTEDPKEVAKWIPLIMKNRTSKKPLAVTKFNDGTDVNFGALTRSLFTDLKNQNVEVHYGCEVKGITRMHENDWEVKVHNQMDEKLETHRADFVFIGCGGGSLQLLQKTRIPESKNIGGFPVSGMFMVCNNDEVVEQHHAKVYGKAKVGAPPMSVPHLDTRYIDGKKTLLFGPFAGFSPKFLKTGSSMDLINSVRPNNIFTMLSAGVKEMSLTKYLIQQVLLSNKKRMNELREFIPSAEDKDWGMITAGQRVQIIKDTKNGGKGTLQFGTEVVSSADGSIAALLGASPGASTAVHVMLEVLEKCFPEKSVDWKPKIKEMIPSFGRSLNEEPELFHEVRSKVDEVLGLGKVDLNRDKSLEKTL